MLKADLHIHTKYSLDCQTPLEDIIKRCREVGVNCINVCDHGTTEGAIEMQRIAPFPVIVSEEILTDKGEIMGMFLKETIPSFITVPEALARIKEQGGLVCVPHPYDKLRPSAIGGQLLEEIRESVDAVEIFNARDLLTRHARQAERFSRKYEIPGTAGSDAHTIGEIGHAYVEMPEFNGKEEFLKSLAAGNIIGHRSNPFTHFFSFGSRIKKKFGG